MVVIDIGVDYKYLDLVSNMWKNVGEIFGNLVDDDCNGYIDDVYGFDWVNEDGDLMDDYSYGIYVVGIIGVVGNNNCGVVGVSFNVSIMFLKFYNLEGGGNIVYIVVVINYVVNMGVDIINVSYGGFRFSKL